jgi:hypothetical protein
VVWPGRDVPCWRPLVLVPGFVRDSDSVGRDGVRLGPRDAVELRDVVVGVVLEAVREFVLDVELDAGAVVDELVVCARGAERVGTIRAD